MLDTEAVRQSVTVPIEAANSRAQTRVRPSRGPLIEDILSHLALVLIAFIVLFPILWVVSMALDPRNISRPSSLTIIPPGASLDAFRRVLTEDHANGITFAT